VSQPSYAKAFDKILKPRGFQREGNDWIRTRGDISERVDLQVSSIAGFTANVAKKDLETERIIRTIPCHGPVGAGEIIVRIGDLIDGRDRWWKNDPLGPAELSEAIETYGLPWFDGVNTLEEQAAHWYGRGARKPWRGPYAAELAVTLYRMGELDEALALFDPPAPKTVIPFVLTSGRCVQRWLQEQLERR
jgi:hypothetical protein